MPADAVVAEPREEVASGPQLAALREAAARRGRPGGGLAYFLNAVFADAGDEAFPQPFPMLVSRQMRPPICPKKIIGAFVALARPVMHRLVGAQ